MPVTDFRDDEIATELLKLLWTISLNVSLCKLTTDNLISYLQQLLPIIQEIIYSGVEVSAVRQAQLDRFSELLRDGMELATKVLNSVRWNFYKNLMYARKLERLDKRIPLFIQGPLQAHFLADIRHLRFYTAECLDRLHQSNPQIETSLGSLRVGVGPTEAGWMEEVLRRAEEDDHHQSLVNLGLDFGKKKVKEMIVGRDDLGVVEISGIGGSGKTTLAREFCRDDEIKSHFMDRILS